MIAQKGFDTRSQAFHNSTEKLHHWWNAFIYAPS